MLFVVVDSSLTLFDEAERVDPRPRRDGESSFEFLNRVHGRYWERVRLFLEEAFHAFPPDEQERSRRDFRSANSQAHVGAWWEIYLAFLFNRLGWEVEPHPGLVGTDRRPDFRLRKGSESFLLEATHVNRGLRTPPARGSDRWITSPLEELWHPNFFVSVRIDRRAKEQPRRRQVTQGVLEWLDSIDPDGLHVDSLPRRSTVAGGWTFTLTALPVRPEARGRRDRGLVGIYPSIVGWGERHSPIFQALSTKAGLYAEPKEPLVIAVLSLDGFTEDHDVRSALIDPNDKGRSLWAYRGEPHNTRVSAVLTGLRIQPWTVASAAPKVWLNPWARHPVEIEGLWTSRLDRDGSEAGSSQQTTLGALVGLPEGWPGPERPFPRQSSHS